MSEDSVNGRAVPHCKFETAHLLTIPQHTSIQTLPIMYNHLGVKQAHCNIWDSAMERENHMDILLKCSYTWTEYGKLAIIRGEV